MKFKKSITAVLAVLAMASGAANAATSLVGLIAGPLANPGSFMATLNSSVADSQAKLDFVINGFRSLDGYNTYQDLFTLTINGDTASAQKWSGSFNLGGGGTSDTSFGSGTAVTVNQNGMNPGTAIGWNGGTTTVTGLTFNLLEGNNTFKFAYSAPGRANGMRGQGLGDEGWGIKTAMVSAVPEPETYAMMLAGLGLIGTIARRRKQKQLNA
jgi:hypothetical protein